ncbi:MAG: hypothetical protein ACP5GC_11275 [Thiomonas sp.]
MQTTSALAQVPRNKPTTGPSSAALSLVYTEAEQPDSVDLFRLRNQLVLPLTTAWSAQAGVPLHAELPLDYSQVMP